MVRCSIITVIAAFAVMFPGALSVPGPGGTSLVKFSIYSPKVNGGSSQNRKMTVAYTVNHPDNPDTAASSRIQNRQPTKFGPKVSTPSKIPSSPENSQSSALNSFLQNKNLHFQSTGFSSQVKTSGVMNQVAFKQSRSRNVPKPVNLEELIDSSIPLEYF